jgi:hypothetical protein
MKAQVYQQANVPGADVFSACQLYEEFDNGVDNGQSGIQIISCLSV